MVYNQERTGCMDESQLCGFARQMPCLLIAVFFPPLPSLLLLQLAALLMFACLQIKHSRRLLKDSLAAVVLPGEMLLWKNLHNK